MDRMDKNGLLNGQWTMDRNGQGQQVTFFCACPFVH